MLFFSTLNHIVSPILFWITFLYFTPMFNRFNRLDCVSMRAKSGLSQHLRKRLRAIDQVQGHQYYMAMLFWYLVKSGASERYCTLAYTGQVSFNEVPERHGHV